GRLVLAVGIVDPPGGPGVEAGLLRLAGLDLVVLGGPDPYGDGARPARRRLVDPSLHDHSVRGVIGELHVDRRVVHGRLATSRVSGEVQRVRLPLVELDPGEEGCVEHRGRRLRDAAGEALLQDPALDEVPVDEALIMAAGPDLTVQTELVTRLEV